jgi:hypothetical protein
MHKSTFICSHIPQFRLEFSCKETGSYYLELCKNCRDHESDEFLITETFIDIQNLARGLKVK